MVNNAVTADKAVVAGASISRRQLIRRAREAKGLTQRELGERIGLSQSVVSHIETGDADVAPALLPRIAAELEICGTAFYVVLGSARSDQWRSWIWSSRRPPNEKLLLLSLLDGAAGNGALETLTSLTGLNAGTVRSLADGLVQEGLLLRLDDPRTCGEMLVFADQRPEEGA